MLRGSGNWDRPPLEDTTPAVSGNLESARTSVTGGPSTEQVISHLDLILGSSIFSGAARQQRLLRHLVEKRLQGAGGELKEYTLGVEVFDRGDDFDPRLDPIVRVEASRLRSRLQKYYDGIGSGDKLRITLPRGAYIPSFEDLAAAAPSIDLREQPFASASAGTNAPSLLPIPAVRPVALDRKRHWAMIALLGVLAITLGVVGWLLRSPKLRPIAPAFVTFSRITNDEVPCMSPSFSPDGKFLVYTRREAGRWDLYERDLSSLAVTELTPGFSADNLQPAWSPDGKNIVFRSEREGGGIFLLDTKTRKISQLTDRGYHPAWSPDSSKIVYSSETFSDPAEASGLDVSAIFVVDVRTKRTARLGSGKSIYDAIQPSWSPDGRRIAFWGTDRDGERDIWSVAANAVDGRPLDAVRVTHDTWTDWDPQWSPDGRYLYFSSDRGGSMNLWRAPINQSTGKVLGHAEPVTTPSPYSGWVSFAPNGKKFAYVHRLVSSQLYRAPFSVDKGVALDKKVQLTFGERSLREPNISPDGKWIVVRMQDPQEDLALIRPDGTDLHRITNDAFNDRTPRWSNDGKQIVFLSNRTGKFEIWSIRPNGAGLAQLTRNGPMFFTWTPDGTLVGYPVDGKPIAIDPPGRQVPDLHVPSVFAPIAWSPTKNSVVGRMRSEGFGAGSLFIYTASSEDYWEIAPRAYYPSTEWLADDKHLLFSQQSGIFLADVRTHQIHPVADGSKGEMHSRFTLSPDGKTFFFISSDDEEDIWIGSQAKH